MTQTTAPPVHLEPRPANDFARYIHTYWSRCRERCPRIIAIAGKWSLEDLIPGLSDFDTRFLADDTTTADDWARISIEVGRVHTELAREVPGWARNLEHLPGVNLTLSEITDPIAYYPEFPQWTFYHGDAAVLKRIAGYLAAKPWEKRDELFQLKRFVTYFGPYQRGIDPPVNLGAFEGKYALHSRYLHYFAPPVQAAVCLMQRKAHRGKLDSLRLARNLFPHPEIMDGVLASIESHYDQPGDYAEPRLTQIERGLETYLQGVIATLAPHATLMKIETSDTPASLKRKLAAVPYDPAERFFDGVKFCRLMKGRLLFYAQEIAWFDAAWLIRNELGRIVRAFFDTPLNTYGQVRFKENLPADAVLDRLRGEMLDAKECDGLREFARLAGRDIPPGEEKRCAREVAEAYDPVLRVLEILGTDLRTRLSK